MLSLPSFSPVNLFLLQKSDLSFWHHSNQFFSHTHLPPPCDSTAQHNHHNLVPVQNTAAQPVIWFLNCSHIFKLGPVCCCNHFHLPARLWVHVAHSSLPRLICVLPFSLWCAVMWVTALQIPSYVSLSLQGAWSKLIARHFLLLISFPCSCLSPTFWNYQLFSGKPSVLLSIHKYIGINIYVSGGSAVVW